MRPDVPFYPCSMNAFAKVAVCIGGIVNAWGGIGALQKWFRRSKKSKPDRERCSLVEGRVWW
jgi:hypothetical protein